MLINVIIPVYNAEKHLIKCLDSVLNQTYEEWKAIIVDDGSSDRSGTIADMYAENDPRFVVLHKVNEGPYLARLDGIEQVAEGIVMFLDSDDCWEPYCLERITSAFANTEADIVMFPAKVVQEDGVERGTVGCTLENEGYVNKRLLCEKLLTCNDFNSMCLKAFQLKLFKTETIKETIGKDARMGEDKIMLLPLITQAEKIYFVQDTLYRYIHYIESGSHNFIADKIPVMLSKELFAELYEYLKIWGFDDTVKRKIEVYYLRNVLCCYYHMRKSCIDKDEKRKFREYPWKDELYPNLNRYLFGTGLTVKEKVKLIIMRVSVR